MQESREVKAKAEETQRRMFEEHERLSATLNNLRNRMVSTAGEEGAAAHDAATDVGGGGSLNAALARASTANKLENELEKDAQIAQLKEDLLERKRIAKEARDEQKFYKRAEGSHGCFRQGYDCVKVRKRHDTLRLN